VAAKKQKYYVVWHGHTPGVYHSWDACKRQVEQFPGAIYKSYPTLAEAKEAFAHGPGARERKPRTESSKPRISRDRIVPNSISVDAACSGNPGRMEYRGVWTDDRTEIFHFGPVPVGTNNIGEFLAIVHALAWLKKKGDGKTAVYSDSRNAILWVKKKHAATKLPHTKATADLMDMIDRAEQWLRDNTWTNPLLKWETESWGESPADFGRK